MKTKLTYYQHSKNAKQLLEKGYEISQIEKQLLEDGADIKTIAEIISHLKPKNKLHKSKTGSNLVILGVILLGIGFISCLFFTENELLLNISLYGLTGAGIIILIIGLALIFH